MTVLRTILIGFAFVGLLLCTPMVALAQPGVSTQSLMQAGAQYFASGDYREALELFSQVLEQNPKSGAAYSNRCLAQIRLEAYEGAIADCTEALKLRPEMAEAYLSRGLAHYHLGHYDAAVADDIQFLKVLPEDFRAYYNRALAQVELGQYRAALFDLDQALQWLPEQAQAEKTDIFNDRGLVYAQLHQLPEAIADFNQAIRLDTNNSKAFHNRGCVREQQGNYVAAVQDFTAALRLNPANASTYVNRALAYRALGEDTAALQDLTQASAYFWAQGAQEPYQQILALIRQLQPDSSLVDAIAGV